MGELTVESLSKTFGESGDGIVAVDDIDLDIDDGEFLVLVGPSGCGKSTTLRCIAGLEDPTDGEIRLSGEPITDKRSQDRNIAMVFQNYALYPHMTVRKNMSFGLRMNTDLPSDEITSRVEHAAEIMGIESLLDQKPSELSGGQQQRVALGRAIVRDPDVFLMDEPLSNLDAKLRTQMRTELQNLQEKLGVTTIYVTHDQTEAMTMGDHIAILNNGTLQQIGTPLECYHAPQNQFVAGFIGSPSMNFLSVKFTETADGGVIEHPAFELSMSTETAELVDQNTDKLTLGIRPEDIVIRSSNDEGEVTATVDVVEPLGDRTVLYFDVGDETLTATVSGDRLIRKNDTIEVHFPEEKIHLFREATGEAIKNRELPEDDDAERSFVEL